MAVYKIHKRTVWWDAEEGQVYKDLFPYVQEVEREQSSIFDRFVKLAWLYDPNDHFVGDQPDNGPARVSRNVIASNVDTVTAVIATTEVRARFMTDYGDWSTQRQARKLEWYADGLAKLLEVPAVAERAFKDGALKGTGLVKVYYVGKKIHLERVLVDDIVVDEAECRSGVKPRQMQQRMIVDREELKARFPDYEDEIDRAEEGSTNRLWADYRPIKRNEVVVIETWRLPIGVEGEEGYVPGRHAICVANADLFDEEWHKPHFPFARFVWSERTMGWYGLSLAERIVPHQRRLNKLNFQIDCQLDRIAVPTTFVRMADANLAVKSTSRAGTIVPIKADYPQTIIPPAVSAETYHREEVINEAAYEESGLSRLAATSKKPGGLDSGAALREYRDQTTQRFAAQEKAFERFVLNIIWLALDCCKDMGKDAPMVLHRGGRRYHKLNWKKVDMGDVRVQIQAASNISRTPAGRAQQVLEWAQAGIISTDSAREALIDLDTDAEISLYRAAQENIDRCLEDILDGETIVPEPYDNLKLAAWRGQQRYLLERAEGCPEEILEGIRQYIVQAAAMMAMAAAPAQPGMPMGGSEAAPAGPMAAPDQASPASAFAPEAIGQPVM